MNRQVLKIAARNQLRGNVASIFIAFLIAGLIGGAVSAIPVVGGILGYVVAVLLEFGALLLIYDIVSGINANIRRMFDVFKSYDWLNVALTYFIAQVFTALWSLLFIIPGIIKAISYSMAPYILMENPDMKPMDAIERSKQMMNGRKMDYFVLGLSFLPWILLVAVTFGIAGIYVAPYMETTYFNFYCSIKDEPVVVEI